MMRRSSFVPAFLVFVFASRILCAPCPARASEALTPSKEAPDWGPADPRPESFQRSRESVVSDAFLRGKLLAELFADPGVDVFSIRTRVDSGSVTIRSTDSEETASALRAGSIAAHTRGVRTVEVQGAAPAGKAHAETSGIPSEVPPERQDAWVRREVRTRVLTSLEAPIQNLEIRGGKNGVVLLGRVDRLAAIVGALQAAEKVVGAGKAKQRFVFASRAVVPDAVLERRITKVLTLDPELTALGARVSVRGGVARVSADWVTEEERRSLVSLLSQLAGIRGIEGLK